MKVETFGQADLGSGFTLVPETVAEAAQLAFIALNQRAGGITMNVDINREYVSHAGSPGGWHRPAHGMTARFHISHVGDTARKTRVGK